ncbi:transposase [Paucibacter sp. DJ2R-2]|uniref:transposase n=1 Tax=Paucibacter sp. DJ2R-2 TaxID=2893558 RepID=UPI0021E45BD0|nr:transposase [Paucibacter sp. DJ2R-2]MCV2438660.1 transposase [Paucibacter sp. DJ2R-2]
MASEKPARRRNYSKALKAQELVECAAPGASVAKVAHGINANAVHRWRQLLREGKPSAPAISSGFVSVSLATMPSASTPIAGADIQVELRRGAIVMTINWPTSAAAEFAAWTRELLR